MNFDVIIIGGGPAGLMAATSAGTEGAKVLLLDKGDKLGRKLAISGGGRCNVTNAGDIDFIIKNIPGNGRFLYSAFSTFNNLDIIRFFEGLGIALKEEDRGRMFPVSNKAKDVVNALIQKVKSLNVTIRTNTPVRKVLYNNGKVTGVLLKDGESIEAKAVVVAVGGKSVPQTGSTGDGYEWAKDAGHTITELFPTEVPITCIDTFIKDRSLQGLSLRNIHLSVLNPKNHKKIIEHRGDMIFTHYGISGPAALRCSQFVVKALKKFQTKKIGLLIDLFPERRIDEVQADLSDLVKNEPKKAIKNVLKGYVPERMIPILLDKINLKEETTYDHLPREALKQLAEIIKQFPLEGDGTLSIEEAFVTGGGVHLKELDPKTLHSKKMNGLFFCGEILDIHGYTGGFNITAAFTTGFVSGRAAALIT
ncbi:NAD(P)/FAD-dependent oxidoreductase [Ammoniphilus resinae]|uniref:Rossmann fold flavoprotein n=1 Tax=Ammoniphilus resinae TaxID=861532 RepID=A0ABS4GUI5_9BACL|nr:NAD(P)/FAD-dependent oxidoreductase [Ammoniphilus resinae]MBP1933928.1 putative Rossmann fold flavoprotein [Ammoniphilus resinae]